MVAQTVVHTALTNNTQYPPPDLVRIAKSSKIRFGSNQVQRFCTNAPCLNPELNLWSSSVQPQKPWTKLRSGSEKFRFELWFRTKLQHPYLCSFPLIILVYPTLIHYSYLLYLLLWFILPRITHYYLYYIYFLNVSASVSFFGKNQTWCCQTSLLGMPHGQHMFGAIPECPGM